MKLGAQVMIAALVAGRVFVGALSSMPVSTWLRVGRTLDCWNGAVAGGTRAFMKLRSGSGCPFQSLQPLNRLQ